MSGETRVISEPVFGCPVGPWFVWFAWHPTKTTDRGWRWMRFVWRRHYQTKFFLPGPTVHWFNSSVADPRPTSNGGDGS